MRNRRTDRLKPRWRESRCNAMSGSLFCTRSFERARTSATRSAASGAVSAAVGWAGANGLSLVCWFENSFSPVAATSLLMRAACVASLTHSTDSVLVFVGCRVLGLAIISKRGSGRSGSDARLLAGHRLHSARNLRGSPGGHDGADVYSRPPQGANHRTADI